MSGASLITAERRRQIKDEGWTRKHDDGHDKGELARAAAVYALPREYREQTVFLHPVWGAFWPSGWEAKFTPNDRVKELVKAGALIAAEIDRLQRKPKL